MRIVIIEDEKRTARDLIHTIKVIEPNAVIVAQLASVEEAIAFFETETPIDLIFSDIELGDGKSFTIFERVTVVTPIIFCTAFDNYALKAFQTSGIDYILKPFSPEDVRKALLKFRNITQAPLPSSLLNYQDLFEVLTKQIQPAKLPNIILHQGDKIIPIAGDSIALFFIDNGLVKAISFENKMFIVSYQLDELERKFTPHFFRANRQVLISRIAIKEAVQYFNRKLLVHLNIPFSNQIVVGKEKTSAFLDWLVNT